MQEIAYKDILKIFYVKCKLWALIPAILILKNNSDSHFDRASS